MNRSSRGAVLLLVLGAVAILALLAVEVAHRCQVQASQVARYDREAAFRRLFDSGIEVAKGMLGEHRDDPRVVHWGEGWNKEISWELGPGEKARLRIEDEAGKLNILKAGEAREGAVVRQQIARLFGYLKQEEPRREEEWADAEARLWRRLGIEEKKSKSDKGKNEKEKKAKVAPDNKPEQDPRFEPPVTLDGLREAGIPLAFVFRLKDGKGLTLDRFLTTFGEGKVNLNTAPLPVLHALDHEFTREQAEQIAAWRGGEDADEPNSRYMPFKQAKDLEQVPGIVQRATIDGKEQVVKNLFLNLQDRVAVGGRVFSVRMQAEADGRTRHAVAYLEVPSGRRDQPEVEMILFEEIEP